MRQRKAAPAEGNPVSMAELQTGRFKYNDGGWYVGQHCGDGKRHGQGIYTYPNGDVFDGVSIVFALISIDRIQRGLFRQGP